MSDNNIEAPDTGVSRRTVTKAMAWAVPAVAVAVTVPMAAASCVPEFRVDPTQSCKKTAGDTGYRMVFDLEGNGCAPVGCTLTIDKITQFNKPNEILVPGPITGIGQNVLVNFCDPTNAANKLDVYYHADCIEGGELQGPVTLDMGQIANSWQTCLIDPCAE